MFNRTNKSADPDKLTLKHRKGTWKRFIMLFPKCRLPWLLMIAYLAFDLGTVNIGVSETDYTAQLFAGDTSSALLAKLIGIILLNLLATNVVVYLRIVTSAAINRNMRGVVLEKVLKLPMSFFKDEQPREAIYRIVNNATVIDSTFMSVIFPLLTAFYTAGAVFTKVFRYDWRLSMILIAFIPIQILVAVIFGRINFSLSERDAYLNASLTEKLAELVTNIPLAKAFAKEKKEAAKGEEITQRLYKLTIKSSWLEQLQSLSETFVSLIQAVVMVTMGYILLRDQAIDERAWIAFFLFSSVFSGAVEEFLMYYGNLKIIQGSADRVAEIMYAPEEDRSGDPVSDLNGDIEIKDMDFSYTEDHPIFKKLNLKFEDGKVTALIGESGSGKTTIINLLMRLYKADSGDITIGGKSIYKYDLDDYRSQFVTVSQNSMLFSGTIRENVCYGNGNVSDEKLIRALKQAGAYDFVNRLPQGLDTLLNEYGNNLSGGQRQRLAIARALLSDAHYMVLDEPVAAMDTIATADLMDILKGLSGERTMIIIAHSPQVLAISDRVVVLADGNIESQGTPEEVMENSAFLRDFSGEEVHHE